MEMKTFLKNYFIETLVGDEDFVKDENLEHP